jgi:hypothetical protein
VSTFPGSKYTAAHIQGATFVAYKTGGHLLIGHEDDSRAVVADFLRQHRAALADGANVSVASRTLTPA